jgi:hypothetical protein
MDDRLAAHLFYHAHGVHDLARTVYVEVHLLGACHRFAHGFQLQEPVSTAGSTAVSRSFFHEISQASNLLRVVFIFSNGLRLPAPGVAAGPVDVDAVVFANRGIFEVPAVQLYHAAATAYHAAHGRDLRQQNAPAAYGRDDLAVGIKGNQCPSIWVDSAGLPLVVGAAHRADLREAQLGVQGDEAGVNVLAASVYYFSISGCGKVFVQADDLTLVEQNIGLFHYRSVSYVDGGRTQHNGPGLVWRGHRVLRL